MSHLLSLVSLPADQHLQQVQQHGVAVCRAIGHFNQQGTVRPVTAPMPA